MKSSVEMTKELTGFLNLPVYTNNGVYVGETKNIIIDTDSARINTLLITGVNPSLISEAKNIGIPYRWISAIGDIIILSHFPEKISADQHAPEEK